MNQLRNSAIALLLLLSLLLPLFVSTGVVPNATARPSPLAVRLASSTDPSSALIYVAYEKGYFKAEGADVSLSHFTTGKAALHAVDDGKADLATIADTVLVQSALDRSLPSALATIAESNKNHMVLALKDRGISSPRDLTGKRIGVTKGTSGDFFLYIFCLYNRISPDKLVMVDLKPEQMLPALAGGTIDAAASWYPTAGHVMRSLGHRVVRFQNGTYTMTWNLTGKRIYLQQHEDAMKRVLRALIRARKAVVDDPEEAIRITSRYSGTDLALLRNIWDSYSFDVSLTEAMLMNLEDQKRWQEKIRKQQGPQDVKELIFVNALRTIDPGAVTVIP